MSHGAKVGPRGGPASRARDQARTARLLLDAEIASRSLAPGALDAPAVRAATRVRGVPPRPVRLAQQVRYKLGQLDFESSVTTPLLAARRAVLGENDEARPRFLIRVDEFPHYQAWDRPERFGVAEFERFHQVIAGAGIPYLLAVLPRVSREPLAPDRSDSRSLEPAELEVLRRLACERVSFGLHGRDHRTRFSSPRRHSELSGLDLAQTAGLLDEALEELAGYEIHPDVFVPPYNRFDAGQLEPLSARFTVVCGGPESIGKMGFQRSPQWRGESVYLPSYRPFYGTAAEVLPAVERAIGRSDGLWIPVVLHWGWEQQAGWHDLERLAERIAPYAARWEDFREAVLRSRASAPILTGEVGRSGGSQQAVEVDR